MSGSSLLDACRLQRAHSGNQARNCSSVSSSARSTTSWTTVCKRARARARRMLSQFQYDCACGRSLSTRAGTATARTVVRCPCGPRCTTFLATSMVAPISPRLGLPSRAGTGRQSTTANWTLPYCRPPNVTESSKVPPACAWPMPCRRGPPGCGVMPSGSASLRTKLRAAMVSSPTLDGRPPRTTSDTNTSSLAPSGHCLHPPFIGRVPAARPCPVSQLAALVALEAVQLGWVAHPALGARWPTHPAMEASTALAQPSTLHLGCWGGRLRFRAVLQLLPFRSRCNSDVESLDCADDAAGDVFLHFGKPLGIVLAVLPTQSVCRPQYSDGFAL